MSLPRKLSTWPHSPNYDKRAVSRVNKVFVDNVHVPNCVAYDMDAGWAISKNPVTRVWTPKIYGVVTVTEYT